MMYGDAAEPNELDNNWVCLIDLMLVVLVLDTASVKQSPLFSLSIAENAETAFTSHYEHKGMEAFNSSASIPMI